MSHQRSSYPGGPDANRSTSSAQGTHFRGASLSSADRSLPPRPTPLGSGGSTTTHGNFPGQPFSSHQAHAFSPQGSNAYPSVPGHLPQPSSSSSHSRNPSLSSQHSYPNAPGQIPPSPCPAYQTRHAQQSNASSSVPSQRTPPFPWSPHHQSPLSQAHSYSNAPPTPPPNQYGSRSNVPSPNPSHFPAREAPSAHSFQRSNVYVNELPPHRSEQLRVPGQRSPASLAHQSRSAPGPPPSIPSLDAHERTIPTISYQPPHPQPSQQSTQHSIALPPPQRDQYLRVPQETTPGSAQYADRPQSPGLPSDSDDPEYQSRPGGRSTLEVSERDTPHVTMHRAPAGSQCCAWGDCDSTRWPKAKTRWEEWERNQVTAQPTSTGRGRPSNDTWLGRCSLPLLDKSGKPVDREDYWQPPPIFENRRWYPFCKAHLKQVGSILRQSEELVTERAKVLETRKRELQAQRELAEQEGKSSEKDGKSSEQEGKRSKQEDKPSQQEGAASRQKGKSSKRKADPSEQAKSLLSMPAHQRPISILQFLGYPIQDPDALANSPWFSGSVTSLCPGTGHVTCGHPVSYGEILCDQDMVFLQERSKTSKPKCRNGGKRKRCRRLVSTKPMKSIYDPSTKFILDTKVNPADSRHTGLCYDCEAYFLHTRRCPMAECEGYKTYPTVSNVPSVWTNCVCDLCYTASFRHLAGWRQNTWPETMRCLDEEMDITDEMRGIDTKLSNEQTQALREWRKEMTVRGTALFPAGPDETPNGPPFWRGFKPHTRADLQNSHLEILNGAFNPYGKPVHQHLYSLHNRDSLGLT